MNSSGPFSRSVGGVMGPSHYHTRPTPELATMPCLHGPISLANHCHHSCKSLCHGKLKKKKNMGGHVHELERKDRKLMQVNGHGNGGRAITQAEKERQSGNVHGWKRIGGNVIGWKSKIGSQCNMNSRKRKKHGRPPKMMR